MDLNHLNLRVRDPKGCRDFYLEHFGFGLDAAGDVRAAHDRLAAAGLEVADIEDFDDYVTFRCSDPDGTEIEVFWEAG